MSIDGRMGKWNVVYTTYSGIKKEESPVICYNMNKPWRHAQWIQPVMKRQLLYDSLYEISKGVRFIKHERRGEGEWGAIQWV